MESLYSANAIPVDNGNRLRFTLVNATTDNTLTVTARWTVLQKNGKLSENAESFQVAPNAGEQTFAFKLTDGHLIAATLTGAASGLQSGMLYGVIALQYGDVNTTTQILRLMSGYVLNNAPLNYPLGDVSAVNSGLGATNIVSVSPPGAGTELNFSLATDGRSTLYNAIFEFSASADVADRTPVFTFADANNQFWQSTISAKITANQIVTIILTKNPIPATIPADVRYLPMCHHAPMQQLTITTLTANIQAADEYSRIRLWPTLWAAN